MNAAAPVTVHLATAAAPGAIAIIQLHGDGAAPLAAQLTGAAPTRRARLVDFAEIDEGLAVALRDDWVQLMPHGGPRVVQRLIERLTQLGATPSQTIDARALYPEAASDLEADLLLTLARAASPAAIELLLDQPRRWRAALRRHADSPLDPAPLLADSDRLDRLVTPPTVVVVGAANVGKSTLSNLVMGRAATITADLPGTTRDWVGGLAELPAPLGEIAVHWFDTPGLRPDGDEIEQRAIERAQHVIRAADVLIAMRDPQHEPPGRERLPRPADLHLMNKADLLDADAARDPALLYIAALHGKGLEPLADAVAGVLGLDSVGDETLWAFSPALRKLVTIGDARALRRYAG